MAHLTPQEQKPAIRARRKAEGRCVDCGRVKAADDTKYSTCGACLAKNRAVKARRYADQREKNPPAYSRDARKSFRYRQTHLKNPRIVYSVLDFDVLDLFD